MKITIEKIKPQKDFVLIEPDVIKQSETENGFVLPEEKYTPTPVLGRIIAVGPDSNLEVGQIVFFRRFSIDELKFNLDGKKHVVSLLSDDEIVAVVDAGV